ncbi:MAG: 2-hydroxyacyl-CoA dehydratase family protein [Candidatus Omnitrophota bacterium]
MTRKMSDKFVKEKYQKVLKRAISSQPAGLPGYGPELERLRAKSGLKSTGPFYDLIPKTPGLPVRKDNKPIIGYFCNLVPEELLLAIDAVPVRLCSADYFLSRKGEEVITSEVCPVIKSCCGSFFSGCYSKGTTPNLDLVIVPGTCDGKTKLAELLTPFSGIYFLDLPRNTDYLENSEVWVEKYTRLLDFLKERFNVPVARKELLRACTLTNRRTESFRRIYDFRVKNPGIINAIDYFVMAYASFFTDPAVWAEKANEVYQEAAGRGEGKSAFRGKKILLSGSPILFPNLKLLELVSETGSEICADTLCSAYGRMYDPVVIDEETDEGIIRALALKYVSASICPCFLSLDKLLDRMIDLTGEYRLDGVIYHNLRLCQVFDIQMPFVRQVLREEGIPVLFIKTDLSREDIGQLKTRIEAFIEILG